MQPLVLEPINQLLAALPADDLDALRPVLELVPLPFRGILQRADVPVEHAYFPESGWMSRVAELEDGQVVEVGVIGREGMLGLSLLLGAERDDTGVIVQCDGTAFRMNAAAFHDALDSLPAFRALLLRYCHVFHGQVVRSAACNAVHHIDQRLARWLLMSHDRADGDRFPMTHEFLAAMLAVRRSGISATASSLRDAHLIQYERGFITITDRGGLEKVACECYRAGRRSTDKMFETKGAFKRR